MLYRLHTLDCEYPHNPRQLDTRKRHLCLDKPQTHTTCHYTALYRIYINVNIHQPVLVKYKYCPFYLFFSCGCVIFNPFLGVMLSSTYISGLTILGIYFLTYRLKEYLWIILNRFCSELVCKCLIDFMKLYFRNG